MPNISRWPLILTRPLYNSLTQMAKVDDNRLYDQDDEDYPFENNFIDTPWDDRSKNSKIGIIVLLVSIAVVILACVCSSFVIHYGYLTSSKSTVDVSCLVVSPHEKEHYSFMARVFSVSSKKRLMCVGAVIGENTVLVDEICTRDMPVVLFVGSSTDPRCKKGFAVDVDDMIELDHEGILSKKIILLDSKNSMAMCSTPIELGTRINVGSSAYVIGRPLSTRSRGVTKLPVTVIGRGNCTLPEKLSAMDKKAVICVKDIGRCQIRTGDILVQNGHLFGLASISSFFHSGNVAYFADLSTQYTKILSRVGL